MFQKSDEKTFLPLKRFLWLQKIQFFLVFISIFLLVLTGIRKVQYRVYYGSNETYYVKLESTEILKISFFRWYLPIHAAKRCS